jgi:hypothetical protein
MSVIDSKMSQKGSNHEKEMSIKKANLVKPRQKFAPFTLAQRKERRQEVYKLHFDHGMPATRIAELIKVDRNTINNDLKILYRKAIKDHNSDLMYDEIVEKHLLRLETQRDRLGLYLCDSKDINTKLTIERMIADIDFKIIGMMDRISQSTANYWDTVVEEINKLAESEGLKWRCTVPYELHRISIDSRQDLDKLMKKVLGKPKQEQKQQQQGQQG